MAVNEKGEVVGVVKLFEKSVEVGHISHLAVATEYQHKGIGHLLLRTVEQRARERGFKIIGTTARTTASAYFERSGFRVTGIPTPHLGTHHLVWMEKSLS
jgi:N-acetylglutamate synthase-like GNAT family acetyltransferase